MYSIQSNTSRISDTLILPEAMNNVVDKIDTLFTDGGYEYRSSYLLSHPETKVVIPQRSNVVADKDTHQKNEVIEYILEHKKSRCKREYDYHQRALVENLFSR